MQLPSDYSTLRKMLAETIQSFAKHNEEWDEINKIALDILQAPGTPVKSDLSHKVIAFTENLKENRPILELFYRYCSPKYQKICALAQQLKEAESPKQPEVEEPEQEPYDWMEFTLQPILTEKLESIKDAPNCSVRVDQFLELCLSSIDGLGVCIHAMEQDPELRNQLITDCQVADNPAKHTKDLLAALQFPNVKDSLYILTAGLLIQEEKFTKAFDIIKEIPNRNDKIDLFLAMIQKESPEGLRVCKERLQEEGIEVCELLKIACQKNGSNRAKLLKVTLETRIIPSFSKVMTPTAIASRLLHTISNTAPHLEETATDVEIPFPRYDNKVPEQFDAILPNILPDEQLKTIEKMPSFMRPGPAAYSLARKQTHCISPDHVQTKVSQEGKVTSLAFSDPTRAVSFKTVIPILGTVECGISKIDYDAETKQITVRLSVKETDENKWHPEYKECSFSEEEFSSLWRDIHKSPW